MFRNGLSALASAALAAVLTLSGRAALADAVMGPPEDCPPGSVGRSSHHGPHCAPTTCETDAQCESQMSFRDRDRGRKFECRDQVSVCIEQKDFTSWRRPPDSGGKTMRPVVVGACDRGATCAGTAVCETARRCVDTGAPAPMPTPTPTPTRAATGGATTTTTTGGPSSSSHGAGAGIPPRKGCGCAVGERIDATMAAAMVLCGIGLFVARRRAQAGRSSLD